MFTSWPRSSFTICVLLMLQACVEWTWRMPQEPAELPPEIIETSVPMPEVTITYEIDYSERYKKEVDHLCQELGDLLGSVSVENCLQQDFTHSGQYTVQKRALVYRDVLTEGASTKVLMVGGTHGDEYSSFSIMFPWLQKLALEPTLNISWRVIPALNPDGLFMGKATRMNANGVDINRNFHTRDWEDKALAYWENKTHKDKRRFPGNAPLSEPESKWLHQVINAWQPDVIVSVHAPYGILDFDAAYEHQHQAPNQIGFLHLKLLGTYPGSLGRYAGEEKGIPVLTIELPHAGIMPTKKQISDLWNDLNDWILDR